MIFSILKVGVAYFIAFGPLIALIFFTNYYVNEYEVRRETKALIRRRHSARERAYWTNKIYGKGEDHA